MIGSCRSFRGTGVSRTRRRCWLSARWQRRSRGPVTRPRREQPRRRRPRVGAREAHGGSGAAGRVPAAYSGQRRAGRRRPRARGGGSGLPPSGAARGRAAPARCALPLGAAGRRATLGGRDAAGLGMRRPLGSWGPGRPGFTPRPPRAARASGGASARPESCGRPPLPFSLSPRWAPRPGAGRRVPA